MWGLIPLLAVPLGIMVLFKVFGGKRFTVLEFLSLEGAMVLLLVSGFGLARCGSMSDTEVWNGRITAKPSGRQSCCHCRQVCDTCTRTDSKGRLETYSCNCRQVCDHFQDYWWGLNISTGDRIYIDRCQPNKNRVPKAWINARVGEPAAVEHRYTNYLKADPDSVLIQSSNDETFQAPDYPRVHSFYKIKRAINRGTDMPVDRWNDELMELNANLGNKKQVNVIVIATNSSSPKYAEDLEYGWLYGKKNDLIFVLGAPDGDTIAWARVVTISRVEMLKVKARDEMIGMQLSNPTESVGYIEDLISTDFERTPMAEFEYLSSAAKPPTWALILLYILAIIGSIGGSLFMVYNDVFKTELMRHVRR